MVENIYFGIILSLLATASNGAYCFYYDVYSHSTSYMYCATSCCGTSSERACCADGDAAPIVGAGLGVIAFVAIVTLSAIIIFCCCQKTRGQTGQVCQPACVTTVPSYGLQTTTLTAGYGKAGYTNAALPQQLPTANLSAENTPTWQEPPPAYSTVNPI